MRPSFLIAVSLMPLVALADDPLPKRSDLVRYQTMLDYSPFAVATVVPTAAADFAKDLYVKSVGCSGKDCVVTLGSACDKNFKEYLSTKSPNEHGFAISDIQWSEQIGQTKVIIIKDDGKFREDVPAKRPNEHDFNNIYIDLRP